MTRKRAATMERVEPGAEPPAGEHLRRLREWTASHTHELAYEAVVIDGLTDAELTARKAEAIAAGPEWLVEALGWQNADPRLPKHRQLRLAICKIVGERKGRQELMFPGTDLRFDS